MSTKISFFYKIKKLYSQWTIAQKIIMTVASIWFIALSIFTLYPFIWMLINSFKTMPEYYDNMYDLPEKFLYSNYLRALNMQVSNNTVIIMFFNSVWYSVGATICNFAVIVGTGYVLSKYRFWGKGLIYGICIFIMVAPLQTGTTSIYKLLYTYDIADNPSVFWLTWINGFGFNAILVMGFFNTLSWTYAEAAKIDGAGNYRIFVQVMLPQIMPALAAVMIKHFIMLWNDYDTPWLYLPSYPTLSVGMWFLKIQANFVGGEPIYFAAIILSILPTLIIFLIFSKTIMENYSFGGIKG